MADGPLATPSTPEGWARLRRLRLAAAAGHLDAELRDEAVILQVATRRFHSLDAVGTRIWELLKTPRTFAEVRDAVVAEYQVTPERCEADLLALLRELHAAGLLVLHDAIAPWDPGES